MLDLLLDVLLRHGFTATLATDGNAIVVRDGNTTTRVHSIAEAYDYIDRRF